MPRIDTTIVEWNAPAERHSIDVSYIGTLRPAVMCRTGTPASISGNSNVKLQPITNVTKSDRQYSRISALRPPVRHASTRGTTARRYGCRRPARRRCGDARLHHFQQRTRFGIALREQQKIECLLLGQNHQIRLRVALRDAAGRADRPSRNAARACSGVLAAPSSVVPISDIHPPLRLPFPSAAVRPFPNELPTNPEIRFRRNGRSESLSLTLVAERYGSRAIHDAYVSALQIGGAKWKQTMVRLDAEDARER